MLCGILYVLYTGIEWEHVPQELGFGSGITRWPYVSWANPIEAHFGPLRQFTIANSHHRNHTAQPRALHAYLRWRPRTPAIPTCWLPNAASAPASAARRASAGADVQQKSRDLTDGTGNTGRHDR